MTSSKDYSVTIASCCEKSLHTWLVFNTGETFSLIPPTQKCAVTSDCEATLETTSYVNGRSFDVDIKFDITEAKYKRMIQKKLELESDKTYTLMPVFVDEYNCVTACREILRAGDIDFLNDVCTPVGVKAKIERQPKYVDLDVDFRLLAVLPRLSFGLAKALGFDLKNGFSGWVFGGTLCALMGYVTAKSIATKKYFVNSIESDNMQHAITNEVLDNHPVN